MFTNLQFFPEAASAQAGQVDAVFFFMFSITMTDFLTRGWIAGSLR